MHFTPLIYENLDYAWSFSAELSPEGLIGISGSVLRIFQVPRLGVKLKQDSIPLSYTPRKFITHPMNNYFYLIEGDHRVMGQDAVDKKLNELRQQGKQINEEVLNLPPETFGRPKAPPGTWSSNIRILDPVDGKTISLYSLDNNESAFSIALVPFAAKNNELHLVVGTAADTRIAPRTCSSGFLRVYRFTGEDGKALELIHKTEIDDVPLALMAFQGRLVAGVGKALRIYDIGKKKMLRKVENKQFASAIVTLTTQGSRILVGDMQESVYYAVYKAPENRLLIFADDSQPRWITAHTMVDYNTVVAGDRFGNIFVNRLDAKISDQVDDDPTGAGILHEKGILMGAPHKTQMLCHFHIGDLVTSIHKVSLVAGGREVLLYTGLHGTIGILVPFVTKEDVDFISTLEQHMRTEQISLISASDYHRSIAIELGAELDHSKYSFDFISVLGRRCLSMYAASTFGERLGVFITGVAATLSALATLGLLIYASLRRWRKRRSSGHRNLFAKQHSEATALNLFLSLVIADLVQAIGGLLNWKWSLLGNVHDGSVACTFQGVIKNIGNIAIAFSTLMSMPVKGIAIHTFVVLILGWKVTRLALRWAVVAIWVFTAVIVLACSRVRSNYYGQAGYWCWITGYYRVERIVGEYLWMWIAFVGMIALYGSIFIDMSGILNSRGGEQDGEQNESRQIAYLMLFYPAAYLLCLVPVSICRWLEFSKKDIPPAAILFSDTIFSLSGLFNTALFYFTRPGLITGSTESIVMQSEPVHEGAGTNDESSLDPHTEHLREGVSQFFFGERLGIFIAGLAATLSVIATSSLLVYVSLRRWRRRKFPNTLELFPRRHSEATAFKLFISLVIADLIQALGGMPYWKWSLAGDVADRTGTCTFQGVFLNIGNIAIAFSILSIAFHTFAVLVLEWRIGHLVLRCTVAAIWIITAVIVLACSRVRSDYYGQSGYWCWITRSYETERIVGEYLWMWIAFFVMIALYGSVSVSMSGIWKSKSSREGLDSESKQIAYLMLVYPAVYLICLGPVSICRWLAFSGKTISPAATLTSDTIFSLSGLFNVILFYYTRPGLITGSAESVATRSEPSEVDLAPGPNSEQSTHVHGGNEPSATEMISYSISRPNARNEGRLPDVHG
ncbi:hypothetical protein NP233_g5100 [Leucocoprinus birnbaumii]|uniref:DNA damage-binding protein 1 n=1 Tax=Leucocoprinus birnbaumii TaxID=56174 RepID=A0AAD5VTG9_9AGAR|nr:hypothetical protein NP233_g5100 [Leucocoprinus birnbaumii]